MVCSTPPPSTIPETEKPEPEMKKEKKKRVFRRETVADRLLASAKKMAEMRIVEHSADEAKKKQMSEGKGAAKLTNAKKYDKTAHEIDDLSALEWETSSERSGPVV
ncbi:hypothetical protein L3Y34_011667 [Caenorhabditis briggsae]|uniref:Uncharacterized protein n=1 Tax=Caenorhabditis briggsae TaxID=6238 RepID=A0AAE8ZSA5_CAEBR|nr:hypothetical protein L3Y34_011667 [Caenorhabditis briggsae]